MKVSSLFTHCFKFFSWLILLGSFFVVTTTPIQAQVRVGVIGSSWADEFRGDDNRGGAFANNTYNWLEQLVRLNKVSAGSWGQRGEPRRSGYEWNWSRTGAMAPDLSGQVDGILPLVSAGQVDVVIIMPGMVNFSWTDPNGYAAYYNGELTGSQIQNRRERFANNVIDAIKRIRNARQIPVIVATIPDVAEYPNVIRLFPDEDKRYEVSDEIMEANYLMEDAVYEEDQFIYYTDDFFYNMMNFFDEPEENLLIGDETISFVSSGDDPHNLFLGDNSHFGTIANSFLANDITYMLYDALNVEIDEITEDEMLAQAGIGGSQGGPPTATPTQPPTATSTSTPTVPITSTATPTQTITLPPGVTNFPSISLPASTFTPTPPVAICNADINQDNLVDISDYWLLLHDFLKTAPKNSRSDINRDKVVDISDYSLLTKFFLKPCN